MLGSWQVDGHLEEIWIVPRFGGATPPAGATRIDAAGAELRVSVWFPEDTRSSFVLTEIVRHLERHLLHRGSFDISWLRTRVAVALREGRLEAYGLRRTFQSGSAASKAVESKKDELPPTPKEERTWIAIQLVDKRGKPVAYKRFAIELADGSSREGMLDDKGTARVEGIDPGTCKVSFPALDARDWQPA